MPMFSALQPGLPDRLIVEGEVDAVQRDAVGAGTGRGVGLVADGAEDRRGEGGRVGGDRKLLDIETHLVGDVARHVRIGVDLLEIAARHVIGAEAVIEDAELELNARCIGRVDQHALHGGDGAFVVAGIRGELGIFESEVEVVGAREHFPQQGLAA